MSIEYVDYMESWYKVWCPYCEQINWICNGNEQDVSGIDIDGVRCLACKKVFMMGLRDKIDIDLRGGEFPKGNWNIEEGQALAKEK